MSAEDTDLRAALRALVAEAPHGFGHFMQDWWSWWERVRDLAEHQPTAREAERPDHHDALDGCRCIMLRPASHIEPSEWEQADDCPVHPPAQPAPVAPAGEVPSDVTDLAARLGVDPREIVRWPWSTASPGWYVRTETVEGLLYAAEQRLAVLEEIHGTEILDHADTKDALAAAEHRVDEAQAATWVGWELKVQELTDRAELAEQRLAAARRLLRFEYVSAVDLAAALEGVCRG